MNIEQILSYPIVGTAYSDRELMDGIHEFVISAENSTEDKLKALYRLDQVMGFNDSPNYEYPTINDLEVYLGEFEYED